MTPKTNVIALRAPSSAAARTFRPARIRVLVVDDHDIMRQGLMILLREQPDIEVVGEAVTGEEAIRSVRALEPDVVLMDYGLPGMDGAEATRIIHSEQPKVRILGLSMYDEDSARGSAMTEAGAAAYLVKTGRPDILLAAIRGF